jgi:hypothetical protein
LEGLRHLEFEVFNFIIVNQGSFEFEGRYVLVRVIDIDRHTAVLVLTRSVDMGCYPLSGNFDSSPLDGSVQAVPASHTFAV